MDTSKRERISSLDHTFMWILGPIECIYAQYLHYARRKPCPRERQMLENPDMKFIDILMTWEDEEIGRLEEASKMGSTWSASDLQEIFRKYYGEPLES